MDWSIYAAELEEAVDAQMGEPVRFIPYVSTGGGYTAPIVDASRAISEGVGYVIGRGTFLAGSGVITQRRADADLLLAIQQKYLTNVYQHDRVILTKRSATQTYEISYVEEDPHGRPKLHLLLDKASS